MTMGERYRRGAAIVRRLGWARAPVSLSAGILTLLAVVALAVTPLVAGRGLIQDLFLILTMLALAQYWNMLAGFAGLVSIGQQAFVGLGAYAMFALILYFNTDPLLAIALAGLAAGLIAIPITYLVFRMHGAYFAVGTWVVAEVFRLLLADFSEWFRAFICEECFEASEDDS
jgi:branched-chain amino acid transport system permease protein